MITHLHCYCCSHIFDLHYCCYFLVVLIKYICLYMYVYGCVQIYMNIYMYIYIYIYIFILGYVYMYACVCVNIYMYTYFLWLSLTLISTMRWGLRLIIGIRNLWWLHWNATLFYLHHRFEVFATLPGKLVLFPNVKNVV